MKIKNKSNKVVGIPAFKVEDGKVIREKGNIPLLPDCVMEIPDELRDDIGTLVDIGFVSVAKPAAAPAEEAAGKKEGSKSGKRTASK